MYGSSSGPDPDKPGPRRNPNPNPDPRPVGGLEVGRGSPAMQTSRMSLHANKKKTLHVYVWCKNREKKKKSGFLLLQYPTRHQFYADALLLYVIVRKMQ